VIGPSRGWARSAGRGGAALAILAALGSAFPSSVRAHEFRPAVLRVEARGEGEYAVQLLPPPSSLAGPVDPGDLFLVPGDGCRFVVPQRTLRCRPDAVPRLVVRGLDVHPVEVVARVRDGTERTELVSAEAPELTIGAPGDAGESPAPAGWATTAGQFVGIGVEHILLGFDHLCFVLGLLLLLLPEWRSVVVALTAFTVAHSVTLALSALDLVRLSPAPVEAIIAASVLLVAVEAARLARGRPPGGPLPLSRRRPALVALAFGLVHGLGFAGALREIGLPAGGVVPALAGFNVGVELGQLAVVGAVLLLALGVRRVVPNWIALVRFPGAYVLGTVAAAWTLDRFAAAIIPP